MGGKVPLCDICRDRYAEYVCSNCGNLVCRYDFDPYLRVCRDCMRTRVENIEVVEEGYSPVKWFLLVFLGFIILSFGLILWALGSMPQLSGESFIVIAPFPFIFYGRVGIEVAILVLVIFLIFILFLLRYFRFSTPSGPS